MDKKQQIAGFALRRFMQSGYSPVTMDEIARGCGIGKASLYALFASKEELLLYSIDCFIAEAETEIGRILQNDAVPPVQKFRDFFGCVSRRLSGINNAALSDIWRCVPGAGEKIENGRRKIISRSIAFLLREGKENGIFEDVDEALTAELLAAAAKHFINPEMLSRFGATPDQMMEKVLTLVLRGCLTEKGREMIPASGNGR